MYLPTLAGVSCWQWRPPPRHLRTGRRRQRRPHHGLQRGGRDGVDAGLHGKLHGRHCVHFQLRKVRGIDYLLLLVVEYNLYSISLLSFPERYMVTTTPGGGCTNAFSGTSSSAAVAGGVMALMLHANPKWEGERNLLHKMDASPSALFQLELARCPAPGDRFRAIPLRPGLRRGLESKCGRTLLFQDVRLRPGGRGGPDTQRPRLGARGGAAYVPAGVRGGRRCRRGPRQRDQEGRAGGGRVQVSGEWHSCEFHYTLDSTKWRAASVIWSTSWWSLLLGPGRGETSSSCCSRPKGPRASYSLAGDMTTRGRCMVWRNKIGSDDIHTFCSPSRQPFEDWKVLTLELWGEQAVGDWTLEVTI